MSASYFQNNLLKWFDQHGRKTLPWQINKTPYRVYISEVMLQQTQVSTVIPYFLKFMHVFPDIAALAHAHEDEVLHLWAGLGYYSRARSLHAAAKKVMQEFGGVFPATFEDLISLPGVGPSTAGAILAIAYNQKATILDGNVKRVLARFHAVKTPINEKKTEEILWEYADRYTPTKRVADYTQAIMDLGATLCTRSKPDCAHCPLRKKCEAYALGMMNELPVKKAAAKIPTKQATFLIIRCKNKILLQKRPSKGIWGGLFSLPEISGVAGHAAVKALCRKQLKLAPESLHDLPAFRHTFSHYHLEIHPTLIEIKKPGLLVMEDGKQLWYDLRWPGNVGLPRPVQKLVNELGNKAYSGK